MFLILFLFHAMAWADNPHCLDNGQGQPCLVSGNGFGYAVVSQEDGGVVEFYSHPYSAEKPDPTDPQGERAIKTPNLVDHAIWKVDGMPVGGRPQYTAQTQVIGEQKSGVTQNFFMPFDLKADALIATADMGPSSSGCLDMKWGYPVQSQKTVSVDDQKARVISFKGTTDSIVAVPLTAGTAVDGTDSCLAGSKGWALMVAHSPADVPDLLHKLKDWKQQEDPATLAARETRQFEQWRKTPPVCFSSTDEQRLFRQSETILRMGQIQEPNDATHHGHGLINASLPPGEWTIPWVRDMSYSVAALSETGHQEEARAGLTAFFDAGPMGVNKDVVHGAYQISTTRYWGNGAENADKSGQPRRNLEFDDWGLSLWAMGQYYNKYHDTAWLKSQSRSGQIYQTARDKIVKSIFANTDKAGDGLIMAKDTSSWEQNSDAYRHYAWSTITAIAGLKNFLPMAKAMGDEATVKEVQGKIALLEKGFNNAFVHGGAVHGTLESSPRNDMDGILLEGINMGVITDPKLIKSTLDRMSLLRTTDNGYLRVHKGDDEYEKHEFLFIDINLARAYLRTGQFDKADSIMQRLTQKSTVSGKDMLPEMYISAKNESFAGSVGDPTGAVPMVGFGAADYNLYLVERQKFKAQAGNISPAVATNADAPAQCPAPIVNPASTSTTE